MQHKLLKGFGNGSQGFARLATNVREYDYASAALLEIGDGLRRFFDAKIVAHDAVYKRYIQPCTHNDAHAGKRPGLVNGMKRRSVLDVHIRLFMPTRLRR